MLFVLFYILSGTTLLPAAGQAEPPTGILGASSEEIALLHSAAANAEERYIEGIRFFLGEIAGRPVVISRTGVGKVNAALITTLLVEHFRPANVIVMGVAGGTNPELSVGDVIIAERTAHHDLGSLTPQGMQHWGVRNPVDGRRNPVFFPSDSLLVALAQRAGRMVALESLRGEDGPRPPKIVTGVIVTGDVFVASSPKRAELHQALGADAVEMEGAAAAQICWQFGIPFLVVRCLSDSADENAGQDYEQFSQITARNSALLVIEVIRQFAARRVGTD
jgi:adenosylhomocysteine nucleosidase